MSEERNQGSDYGPITIPIVPMGKPRMTQRDKWKQRTCVVRYRAFSDNLRLLIPADLKEILSQKQCIGLSWKAFLPIPKSWTQKKKKDHRGILHLSKPDRDNIDKAILDSLFKEDSGIATGHIEKRWDDGEGTRLILTFHF